MIDISAISRRAMLATAGPWTISQRPSDDGRQWVNNEQYDVAMVYNVSPTDAEFIAHARFDVLNLCDEIFTLRATIKAMSESHKLVELVCEECGSIGKVEDYDHTTEAACQDHWRDVHQPWIRFEREDDDAN